MELGRIIDMNKMIKTAILGVSALALPFTFAATVNAAGPSDADTINTKLEYQMNAAGTSMRFISTMELNGKSLDDITSIEMNFKLTKNGEQDKDSIPQTTTTVYESISGENGKAKVDGTYYAVATITNIDSKAGWRITPTFTYNYADGSSEDATASAWLIGGKRQYFVQKYDDWGTNLYYYMFGTNVQNANFPGEQMHLYDADNSIYYFDYMPDAGFTTVVFSDGSDTHKSGDMPVSSSDNYYIQQDGNAYAHPTTEHNIVTQHNDNRHWSHCTICGDDFDETPHNLSGSTSGTTRTISCSDCGYSVSFDTTVLYVTRNWTDWTNLHAHIWYNNGTEDINLTGNWPGQEMTYDHTNDQGEEVYKVTIPENAEWIIINNGESDDWKKKQTVNIKLSDYENYNAFYFEWRDDKNQVGGYLYIPE
jgi:hypothetical protein